MASSSQKTPIMGNAQANAEQMRQFVKQMNPDAPDYAESYLTIGERYGVRGDLAFCQSIHETNAWKFTGTVKPEQNNFAGLGTTGPTQQGASFDTPEQGIEAQIQHLYGYATTQALPAGTQLVDPRFTVLEQAGLRGTAPNWEDLDGKWAVPGDGYGESIVALWNTMLSTTAGIPDTTAADWKQEAMQWLQQMQLIDSEHDPDAPVTWAEFGTVLRRLQEK